MQSGRRDYLEKEFFIENAWINRVVLPNSNQDFWRHIVDMRAQYTRLVMLTMRDIIHMDRVA